MRERLKRTGPSTTPQAVKDRHQRFVHEYLANGLNAKEAAMAVGYSKKTAHAQGCRLMKLPEIQKAIAAATENKFQKLEITAERVLQGLANLAFFDIRKLYDEAGNLKPVAELDEITANALCGIEVEEAYEHFGKGQAKPNGVLKKIKMADRGINLERLGRYFKLFTDKIEVDATESVIARLAAARQRKK